MSDLIINVNDCPNACCGNCKHNKNCENYQSNPHHDWLCGLYQKGGSSIKQLSLFGDDYE